jgi:hypothetical protein
LNIIFPLLPGIFHIDFSGYLPEYEEDFSGDNIIHLSWADLSIISIEDYQLIDNPLCRTIILAAGFSSRMHSFKPLLHLGDRVFADTFDPDLFRQWG